MKPSEMSELDIARAFVAWVDSEGKLEEPPHPRPYMMARALAVTADLLAEERKRVAELESWLRYALEHWAPAGSEKVERAAMSLAGTSPGCPHTSLAEGAQVGGQPTEIARGSTR